MSKAIKEKKVKPTKLTEPVEETAAPVIEKKSEEADTPSTTIEVEETAPTVTEELLIPIIEKTIEQVKQGKTVPNEELTMEEKIIKFLDSRQEGQIRMNDFLKSLFPPPSFGQPPLWSNQHSSKQIRVLLQTMISESKIELVNNAYQNLGRAYYPDHETGKTAYHDLSNTVIICQK